MPSKGEAPSLIVEPDSLFCSGCKGWDFGYLSDFLNVRQAGHG
jgi:hypothetical protein